MQTWWDAQVTEATTRSLITEQEDELARLDLERAVRASVRDSTRADLESGIDSIIGQLQELRFKLDSGQDVSIERVAAESEALASRVREVERDTRKAMTIAQSCWRKQRSNLCGWHAVDVVLCALGVREALELSEFDQLLVSDDFSHEAYYNEEGYGVEALENVMRAHGLRSTSVFRAAGDAGEFASRVNNISDHDVRAIIMGSGGHWTALVRVNDSWFNADSLNPESPSKTCGMMANVRYFHEGLAGVKRLLLRKVNFGDGVLLVH